jgi:hypothetical protein
MDALSITDWIGAVNDVASALAIAAAGWWFLWTNRHKQRVEFDVDCRIFPVPWDPGSAFLEVWFLFDNRGFLEHRLYDLRVSVHVGKKTPPSADAPGRSKPWHRVTSEEGVVPPKTGFYFVRPGVHQVVRHTVVVPADAELVRVTASFGYHRGDKYPHTARRIFSYPQARWGRRPEPSPTA